MKAFLIAVAGAAGALTRYGIGVAVGTRSFPWSTLGINLTGSFVLGYLAKLAVDHEWSSTTTLPITVGFLGAYTTFSTFSVETHTLLRDGRVALALGYIAASVIGGIAVAAIGYSVAS